MIVMIVLLGVLGLYVVVAMAVSSKRHEKVSLAQVSEIVQRRSKLDRGRFEAIISSLKSAPELQVEGDKPGVEPSVEKLAPQKKAPVALKFAR